MHVACNVHPAQPTKTDKKRKEECFSLSPLPLPTWLTMLPTTPFWPCRELNLSPSSGRRVWRTSTLTTQELSSLLVSSTWGAGGWGEGWEGG